VTKKHGGSKRQIRKLTKADVPGLRDHLFRLDPDSRRNRFLGNISDTYLSTYPERCCEHGAEAIGYFEDGVMRGVAEMHLDEAQHSTAEVAFSVEPEFRRAGIGSELFRRLIGRARESHIDQLRMNCHPQNREMQALARKFHAEIAIDRAGNIGRIKTKPRKPVPQGLASQDRAPNAA
jgi:RimJ/RimL family protein N-acetyltransferase